MNEKSTLRIKPFLEYYPCKGKIFFLKNPGSAIVMDDPTGFIASTCKLMDGNVTLSELTTLLEERHPNEAPYLENLLDVLDESKLLEDTTTNKPGKLTAYDITRWQRNIEFFGAYLKASENKYAAQLKLQSIKVTLLGLGGAGSHLLYDMAALGILHIKAVDFDKVELSNLNRQILYNESDIGHFKTDIAKNRILQFCPNANIQFINKKIISHEALGEIISGQDIVISVIDQPREHIIDWVNISCVKHNIPFICGAFDWKWALYYSVMPRKTGCIECWKNSARKSKILFQELMQKKVLSLEFQ